MSPFFERRKREYMDLLLGVSTHGRWDLWIQFCLEGVVAQAIDTERRCTRLLEVDRDFRGRLKDGSVRLATLVDDLFLSPIVTVKSVEKQLNVTYPTAHADLKKLLAMGIVEPLKGRKLLTYFCPDIYRITYADDL